MHPAIRRTAQLLAIACVSLYCTSFLLADALLAAEPSRTVRLVVAYGDGVEKHFTRLDWKTKMTVLAATELAAKHPRGIEFKARGRGATAFIYEIDRLRNESNGRGWLYKVNGEFAERSCGVYEVQPGDVILWTFEKYR